MKYIKNIKIAFVHDDFIQFGGAEKLFLEVILKFQRKSNYEVEVFSSLISKPWKKIFLENKIPYYESFLAKIPFCYNLHKSFFLFNFFYYAFQEFNFDGYDIVISSSTRFGHSIITKPNTYHISYVNSPSRALWDEKKYFFGKGLLHKWLKFFLPAKRIYDFYSMNFSDLVITNSKNIRSKFLKVYRRNSVILYPFSESNNAMSLSQKKDFYLVISRLVSWKRIDYVIEAFNQNGKNLIVIGEGSEKKMYQNAANNNICFLGFIPEQQKLQLLQQAQGLIFPQNEDFGITLLEAISAGCPIVYLNQGGAREVLNSKLGISYPLQTSSSLNEALGNMGNFKIDQDERAKKLRVFSQDTYIKFLEKLIETKVFK